MIENKERNPVVTITRMILSGIITAVLSIIIISAIAWHFRSEINSFLIGLLEQRLAGIEQNSSQTTSAIPDSINDRLANIEKEIATLHRSIPDEATMLRLKENAHAGEQLARDIARQHHASQAMFLALGQLRDAVNRGDGFAAELATARKLGGDDAKEPLDLLAPFAASGIPSKERLISDFSSLSKLIIDVSTESSSGGYWKKIQARLSHVISIRRVDGTGYSPMELLGSAEQDVMKGRLHEAAQKLRFLPAQSQNIAQQWIDSVGAREQAGQALGRLETIVIQQAGNMAE